jgi:hypothetical protein
MTDRNTHQELHCDRASSLNVALLEGFHRFQDAGETRRSHYFGGRYENIYISRDTLPVLGILLDIAREYAAKILELPVNTLKVGGWFNAMHPGDATTLHTHNDDGELLSCVYYVDVAHQSGELVLHYPDDAIKIMPDAGKFVFFPPELPHEVTVNRSTRQRLSVGINIGY